MTTLVVMSALVLITAPFEAVKMPREPKVYRKPDANRHKKSPFTFHSNGL